MKIKSLSVLLIFVGIIISGTIGAQSEPFMHKDQEDLYQGTFHPHRGFLDHRAFGDRGILEMHTRSLFFGGFHPYRESTHNMKNATYLLDRNIEKAEKISAQLEGKIQRYKSEGKDVSRLESSLGKYNLLIKEAKEFRANANASVTERNSNFITNFNPRKNSSKDIERQYLIKSQKKMIQANHALKDVFDEFRQLMPGSEELNNTSSLNASGRGRAFLKGSFTLNLHVEKGEIAIPYLSPDSEIDIEGDYVFKETEEPHDKMHVYYIHSADVKISGSDKTVMLRGGNITLTANGAGYSTFVGEGTYRIENAGGITTEQRWEPPIFEEEMHPHHKINSSNSNLQIMK